jgi:DHA1 family tetracycline resistance protein-like MFS transporter
MVYAIVADICIHNRDSITLCYGYVGAVFGLAFIIGPVVGSLLVSSDLQSCFWMCSGLLLGSLALAITIFVESCPHVKHFSYAKIDPFTTIYNFFSHTELAHLSIPYMTSHLSSGMNRSILVTKASLCPR